MPPPNLCGIRVKLDGTECCSPHAIIAPVADDDGFYELRCAICSSRGSALPDRVATFLQDVVRLFGTPAAPISLRAITQEGTEMNRESVFPSRFFKAAELVGAPLNVEIASSEMIDLKNMQGEPERKLALSFAGLGKQLIVNRTNYDTLADSFGDDTNSWPGKTVELYATKTRIGPKLVDCVRIRVAA